jgi:hypothetical protein
LKAATHTVSRQDLANLVFGKKVTVEWYKRDRYKGVLGKVLMDGQDANLAQIREGSPGMTNNNMASLSSWPIEFFMPGVEKIARLEGIGL